MQSPPNRGALARYGLPAFGLAMAGLLLLISPSGEGPATGQPAPELVLADLSGRPVALSDARGKVLLLDFWATWCDSCQAEVPNLATLSARMAGRDFELLAVALDEAPEDVAEFSARRRPAYRIVLADPTAATTYGVRALPMKVLIGKDGRVVRSYLGEADFREIESDIIGLLNNGRSS